MFLKDLVLVVFLLIVGVHARNKSPLLEDDSIRTRNKAAGAYIYIDYVYVFYWIN